MTHRCAIIFVPLVLALSARAEPLDIQLVSNVTSIKPGEPFYLALALKHGAGYHTYWKHPGIVGVPTQIQWKSVPRGFRVGEIQWPEPERTYMFSIKAQGYDRDVCLPIPVYPPKKMPSGKSLTFKGQAAWMCCATKCNPGFKDLEITLSLGDGEPNDRWNTEIGLELNRGISEMSGWASTAKLTGPKLQITLKPLSSARPLSLVEVEKMIYFTEDGVADSNKPQTFRLAPNGHLVMETTIAETIPEGIKTEIRGVIIRPSGWLSDGSIRAMRVISPLVK
ncbi:MAG: hypothetical protein JNJ83_02075 [Verrucomicrobiaceae bacterium]|nr:hypothetical protein [Verrucomicrobiaceae bacterium]